MYLPSTLQRASRPWYGKIWFILFFILPITIFFSTKVAVAYISSPHPSFTPGTQVHIPEGSSIKEITELLEREHVVKSALLLDLTLRYTYSDTPIQAGSYTFNEHITTQEVARLLVQGSEREPHIKVTLPEGFRARDLKTFASVQFAQLSNETLDSYDGALFPDTYYFNETDTAEHILDTLKHTHQEKMKQFLKDIEVSGYTENEILILASLIEREASDPTSRRMVSGILHNRLKEDIPLQVDATFYYLFEKTSAELTRDDLAHDSPFNTYTNKGLPPHAIANPGLDSIEAALHPTPSDFFYYLTGNDGSFYYAKNFEEHKKNKERYLR